MRTGKRGSRRKNGEGYPQGPMLYRFLSPAGEILYIGQSVNLKRRMSQHKSKSDFHNKENTLEIYGCISEIDMMVYESLLINHYQPKYNKTIFTGKASNELPQVDWIVSYLV